MNQNSGKSVPTTNKFPIEKLSSTEKTAELNEIKNQNVSFEIGRIEGRLSSVERQSQNIENTVDTINVGLGIIVAVVSITATAFYFWMKRRTEKLVASAIQERLKDYNVEVSKEIEKVTTNLELAAQEKAEEALIAIKEAYFKYARILSLVEIKKYETALIVGGITENPEFSHKDLPEEVQAALIKSLCRSKLRHGNDTAWRWVCGLAKKRTKTSLRCLLESASKISREDEAIALYDELSIELNSDEKLELEPILLVLLRRSRNTEKEKEYRNRLTQITKKHEESENVSVVVNIAAIYRDWGLLDHADSMLRAALHRAREAMEGPWDDAYSRLLTTHIANCVDRSQPEEGLLAAKLLLARSNRPDQVFACVRLAWRLPTNNEERLFFANAALNRLKDGYLPSNDDSTSKIIALAHEIIGDRKKCDQIISEELSRLQKENPTPAIRRFIYFLKCFISEIHIYRGEAESIRIAIDHLNSARESDTRGEASFLAACAYGKQNDTTNVIKSLEQAKVAGGNRWLSRAKFDPTLSAIPEVTQLHAKWTKAYI